MVCVTLGDRRNAEFLTQETWFNARSPKSLVPKVQREKVIENYLRLALTNSLGVDHVIVGSEPARVDGRFSGCIETQCEGESSRKTLRIPLVTFTVGHSEGNIKPFAHMWRTVQTISSSLADIASLLIQFLRCTYFLLNLDNIDPRQPQTIGLRKVVRKTQKST